MSAIFAGVFAILWFYRRKCRYLLTLAICYGGVAVSLLLLVLTLPIGEDPTRAIANLMVLLSATLLVLAVFQRAQLAFPRILYGLILAATYSPFLWFLYVEPNVVARIYAINGGVAVIMLTAAVLTFYKLRTKADWMMTVLLVLFAALSIARPLIALPYDNLAPDATIALSSYWMFYSFSHAIVSLLMVFALTTGFALDVLDELQTATLTDSLSGLLNRRGFEQVGQKLVQNADERKLPVSIVLCDLDHFKAINDTFGHHVGDDVIRLFAHVIRDIVQESQIAGRIGGEEFAILIQGGDAHVAEMVAQGIRIGFNASPVPGIGAPDYRLSASFGIAQKIRGETYRELLDRADNALYRAKADGRDCVRTASFDNDRAPTVTRLASI